MKVYISSDMEGSTGITSPEQVMPGSPEYEFGRRMQQHDTLAAARAALRCGADTVLVNDAHEWMINLDPSVFPDGVQIISGAPKLLGMVDGVMESDVAFFVGYHAMAGTEKAVLDHTLSAKVIFSIKLNGVNFGETALSALFCGAVGVPVGLVCGDHAACLEAASILGPELETCEVKEGVGRLAALTLPAVTTEALIDDAVERAMKKAAAGICPKLAMDGPYRLETTFHTAAQTDAAGLVPGSERIAGRTLVYNTDDVFELRRWISSAIDVCGCVPF